ncbi:MULTISPECIES: enoyl-CoA hydratase-related protein [unclassified Bradyrhizobium]|uniref:enoyl-CoA hydratase-related protein n=1 Tax=unclassified Bradyrhizobium TaxID=2631580 RepID=UPI001FF811DF|nr:MULTISPECIES: enoyl-CoA hydratase-related protein [unclassified Bradyrhizobium]MCK1319256.1 enoyl-CoA hydratase/isomerase family protein [Bradyrhizobium sp. 23]MCK1401380.1 enoyl-CoA hydratase/isomerase family protein [Bradyrhizobium sp. 39]MCK1440672.1 enoyl-CoA hydratase/isomerase family protein [Bradyrhizobium sp. 15]MCK1612406.1 enoyl-CoA hydratase/isomerase family protein [Bradyrhizobium sp. 163]MCK1752358.1 enoyl-CoA hydratase/isomerase family protein [Bradyrhizobium sp. 135]
MTEKPDFILSTFPRPKVRLLTLNRTAKRNALSNDLIVELGAMLRRAAVDEDVRCVVLCGNDAFFSAGADIKEMRERGFEAIDNTVRRSAWRDIANFRKPLIAAVEGICFGGGHELALLADIVIAGEGAMFAQPEINIGIMPGDGATQRLPRVAGKSLAMLMILSGHSVSARTAMQAGLVAEVVESGRAQARAVEVAEVIAQKPPRSVELAKAAVLAAFQTTLDAGLEFERQAIRYAFSTADQQEGMDAFFEKRSPNYRGR